MYEEEIAAIQILISLGKKTRARKILRRMLEEHQSADLWYLAATACERSDQELGCLRQVLKLNPQHEKARQRFLQLAGDSRLTPEVEMPPLMALVDDLPTSLDDSTTFEPITDIFAHKRAQQERTRRRWTYLGCLGYILLSVSASYLVLTVLGSPLPGQIRTLLGGAQPVPDATLAFGRPTGQAPVSTAVDTPENYSDQAAAAGLDVKPTKSQALKVNDTTGDVLDPGFFHEYTFTVQQGTEVAVGVQFFSPTARNVSANAAILDANGYDAKGKCQRDAIIADGSSVAFTCQIDQSGVWKLQLYGRAGESTGVYAVTFQIF
ncbi:MAG: hypothetical protein R3E39_21280 [Anaerolineae bacterium]